MLQHMLPPCAVTTVALATNPALRLAFGAALRPTVGVVASTTAVAVTLGAAYLLHHRRRRDAAQEQDGLITALEQLYDGSHRLGATAQNCVLTSLAYSPDIVVSEEEMCKVGLALLRAIEPFANSTWPVLYASFAEGEGTARRVTIRRFSRAVFVRGRACMMFLSARLLAPLRWARRGLWRGAAEYRTNGVTTGPGGAHTLSDAGRRAGDDGRQGGTAAEASLDTIMRHLLRPLLPRFARVPTVAVLRVPLGYEWAADVELLWRALQQDSSTVVDNLVDLVVVEEEGASSAHSSLRCSAAPSVPETGTTSPMQQQQERPSCSRTERPQLRFGVFGAYAFYASLYTACCLQEKDRVYTAAAASGRRESAPRIRRECSAKAWRRKRDRAALSPASSPLACGGCGMGGGGVAAVTPRRGSTSEEGGGSGVGDVDDEMGRTSHATAAAPVIASRLQLLCCAVQCFFVRVVCRSVSLFSSSPCHGGQQGRRGRCPHAHQSLLPGSPLTATAMARVTPLEKVFSTYTWHGAVSGDSREKTASDEPSVRELSGSQEQVRYKVHLCHIGSLSRPVLQDLEHMLAQLRARWRREARAAGATGEHLNTEESTVSNNNNNDDEDAEEGRVRVAQEGCRRRERMREAVLRLLLQRCFYICSIQLPDMRVYRQVPPTVPRQIAAHSRGFALYRTFAEEIRAQHGMLLRTVDALHDWHRLYNEHYGPATRRAAGRSPDEAAGPLLRRLTSCLRCSFLTLRAAMWRVLTWTAGGLRAGPPQHPAPPSPNSVKSWSDAMAVSLTCGVAPAMTAPPSSALPDDAPGAKTNAEGTSPHRPEVTPPVSADDPATGEGAAEHGHLAMLPSHSPRDGVALPPLPCSVLESSVADMRRAATAGPESGNCRQPSETLPRQLPSTQSTVSSHLSLTAREVVGVATGAADVVIRCTPPDVSPAIYCPLQPTSRPVEVAPMPRPSSSDAAGFAPPPMPDPLHSDQTDYRTMTTLTTTLSTTPHMESNDSASELMAQLVQAFHTHGDASACLFDSSVQPRMEREPWQQSPPQPPSFCGDHRDSCHIPETHDDPAQAGGGSWRTRLSLLLGDLADHLRQVLTVVPLLSGRAAKEHAAPNCAAATGQCGDGAVEETGMHTVLHGDGRVDVRQPFSPTWSDEENWRAERERWVLVQKFVSLYRHLHEVLCHEVTRVQRHCAEALANEGLFAAPLANLPSATRDDTTRVMRRPWYATLWRWVCRSGDVKDARAAYSQSATPSWPTPSCPLRQPTAGRRGGGPVRDGASDDAAASLTVVVGLDGLPRPRTTLDMLNGHYGLSPFEAWLATRYSRRGAAEVFVLDLSASRGDRYYPSSTVMDEVVAHAVLLHHGGRLRDFIEELASAFDLHYAPRTAWGRLCMRDSDYVDEGSQRTAAPPPPPPQRQRSATSVSTTSAGSEGAIGAAESGTHVNRATTVTTNVAPLLSSPYPSHGEEEGAEWESYLGSGQSYESEWAAYGLRLSADVSGSAAAGRQRTKLLRPYSECAHARELREDVAFFCLGQAFLTRDGRDVTAEELQLQRELEYIRDYLVDNRNVLLSAMLTPHGSNRLEGVFGVPATVFPYLLCARESVALMHVLFDSLEGCYGVLNFDHFAQFMRDVYYRDRPELLRQVPRIFRTINRSRRGCITYEELCGWMARQLSCGNNVRPNEHVLATAMSLRLPMVLLLDLKPLWPFLECTLDSLSDGEMDF